jgi:hypothetical protein
MPDERPPEVLTALPRTRPHRRSNKRPTRTTEPRATEPKATESGTGDAIRATPKPPPLRQPAQPAGTPDAPPTRKPADDPLSPEPSASRLPSGTELVGTAVQAAAELAEIGISMTARALRRTVSRLPRP